MFLLVSFAVALATSVAIHLTARRGSKSREPSGALAIGFVVGYSVGVAWLRGSGLSELWPKLYWHWLPIAGWITLLATLVTRWLGNCCEWVLLVGAALVSAWLVVPLWESLWPSRVVLIPLAAVGFSLLIVGYRRGARQTSELTTMGVLGAVSILLAIAITAVFSLEFGKLAAVFTAAGGGSLAFAVWQRKPAKSGE